MREPQSIRAVTDDGDVLEGKRSWRRWVLLGVLAVGLLVGAQRVFSWRAQRLQQQRDLAQQQVYDADPTRRLAASEWLLRQDPEQDPYRLVRARALMELGRHGEAREQLQMLIEKETPEKPKLLALQINSFFAEAENLIARADPDRTQAVVERVMALMQGAEKQAALVANHTAPIDMLMMEARRRQALIQARQFELDEKIRQLSKARHSGLQQNIENATLEVADLNAKIAADDQKLAEACGKLLQLSPDYPPAVEMLFGHHLRRREFDQARGLARAVAGWQEAPATTVGRIADALLTLETRYAVPVTDADLQLVGRLLTHPKQTGRPDLQHELTRAAYALHLGDPDEAYHIAHRILTKEWLNARALCIAAQSFVDEGDPQSGVQLLQRYTELKRDPMVRYTLGVAYLATGEPRQINLGQEALRQCLEIEPNHLPARLRLIESLSDTGFLLEAANDIAVAEEINARHPRVLALKAKLAIESEDLGSIASLIQQQLSQPNAVLQHDDVAMVVAMILDDVPRVRQAAQRLGATQKEDILLLLANRWVQKDPVRRARTAPVIARSLLAYLDRDPLMNPNRPALPRSGSLTVERVSGATVMEGAQRYEPLVRVHLLPRPLDIALECTEIALDQWPGTPALITAAAELNIWLNRPAVARQWLKRLPPDFRTQEGSVEAMMVAYLDGRFEDLRHILRDAATRPGTAWSPTYRWFDLDLALRDQDSKTIADAVSRMLTAHPYAELPLLTAVADGLRRDQPDRAFALLGMAEGITPAVASLARARLNIGLARPADALHDIDKALANENAGTELRRWAAEVKARAHLQLDQLPMAVGVFDQLAGTLADHPKDASIAGADLLMAVGKPAAASEVLSTLLTSSDLPARTLDRILARSEPVMKPTRLRSLVETLLGQQVNEPLLLLYQARAVSADDDAVAERIVRRVLSLRPRSPRALMDLADMLRTIQPDEARKIYKELSLRGGRAAEAAQQVLDSMNRASGAPTPAAALLDGGFE